MNSIETNRFDIEQAEAEQQHMDPCVMVNRWGRIAKHLIQARESIQWLGKSAEDSGVHDTETQKRCYRMAARDLGPAITQAVESHRYWESRLPKQKTMPPPMPMTAEEFAELGEAVFGDDSGRLLTNVEGAALLAHAKEVKNAAIERDGCCGGNPDQEGYCFGIGRCEKFFEAQQASDFVQRWLAWLESLSNVREVA